MVLGRSVQGGVQDGRGRGGRDGRGGGWRRPRTSGSGNGNYGRFDRNGRDNFSDHGYSS